jgi:hypothetical protein
MHALSGFASEHEANEGGGSASKGTDLGGPPHVPAETLSAPRRPAASKGTDLGSGLRRPAEVCPFGDSMRMAGRWTPAGAPVLLVIIFPLPGVLLYLVFRGPKRHERERPAGPGKEQACAPYVQECSRPAAPAPETSWSVSPTSTAGACSRLRSQGLGLTGPAPRPCDGRQMRPGLAGTQSRDPAASQEFL